MEICIDTMIFIIMLEMLKTVIDFRKKKLLSSTHLHSTSDMNNLILPPKIKLQPIR